MASYILKISTQVLADILYFPVWWYSLGLGKALNWLKEFLARKQKALALWVWIKNIFTPMYGQRDISGFLISFFMRLVQIIFRGVVMIFWIIFAVGMFLVWIALPPLVLTQIIYQLI